jgi:hypothetical protein
MYRLYIDKHSGSPYPAVVNERLVIPGSNLNHAKLYRGINPEVNDPAKAISQIYDTTGAVQTNRVPLERLNPTNMVNKVKLWKTMPFRITENLVDGELVTIVYYNDNGHIVERRSIVVENTSFISRGQNARKTVESIAVQSTDVSAITGNSISIQHDKTIADLNLSLEVKYSDGSTKTIASVAEADFDIIGVEQVNNQQFRSYVNVVVKYNLAADETATHTGNASTITAGNGAFVTRTYKFKIITAPISERGLLLTSRSKLPSEAANKLYFWYINGDGSTIVKPTIAKLTKVDADLLVPDMPKEEEVKYEVKPGVFIKEQIKMEGSTDAVEKTYMTSKGLQTDVIRHPKAMTTKRWKTLDRNAVFRFTGSVLNIRSEPIKGAEVPVDPIFIWNTMYESAMSITDNRCVNIVTNPTHLDITVTTALGDETITIVKTAATVDKPISYIDPIVMDNGVTRVVLTYRSETMVGVILVNRILTRQYLYGLDMGEALNP